MNGSSGFELLAADLNARLLKFDAETLTLITGRSVCGTYSELTPISGLVQVFASRGHF